MNYSKYKYNNSKRYNNYNSKSNFKSHGGYADNTREDDQHPEHPVRDALFCVCSFLFSLSFSYLWIYDLLEFEYTWLAVLIAALIISCAVIAGITTFKNSHRQYFAHRKIRKNRHYR